MKQTKMILLLAIAIMQVLALQTAVFSQQVTVKNVSFEQDKDVIIITYDLFGSFKNKYSVTVSLSEDSGTTFPIKPRTIHGDVGMDVTPGLQKQIIWDFMQDFPEGLVGNEFVFGVQAEVIKKAGKPPYLLIGVGAIGAAGALVYFMMEKNEPAAALEKGSITITVPGEIN